MPWVTAAHGVHDAPHDAVDVLEAQVAPQRWKVLLQATEQVLVAPQTPLALAGAEQSLPLTHCTQLWVVSLQTGVAPPQPVLSTHATHRLVVGSHEGRAPEQSPLLMHSTQRIVPLSQ